MKFYIDDPAYDFLSVEEKVNLLDAQISALEVERDYLTNDAYRDPNAETDPYAERLDMISTSLSDLQVERDSLVQGATPVV